MCLISVLPDTWRISGWSLLFAGCSSGVWMWCQQATNLWLSRRLQNCWSILHLHQRLSATYNTHTHTEWSQAMRDQNCTNWWHTVEKDGRKCIWELYIKLDIKIMSDIYYSIISIRYLLTKNSCAAKNKHCSRWTLMTACSYGHTDSKMKVKAKCSPC